MKIINDDGFLVKSESGEYIEVQRVDTLVELIAGTTHLKLSKSNAFDLAVYLMAAAEEIYGEDALTIALKAKNLLDKDMIAEIERREPKFKLIQGFDAPSCASSASHIDEDALYQEHIEQTKQELERVASESWTQK